MPKLAKPKDYEVKKNVQLIIGDTVRIDGDWRQLVSIEVSKDSYSDILIFRFKDGHKRRSRIKTRVAFKVRLQKTTV
jgi:hypothetical protein